MNIIDLFSIFIMTKISHILLLAGDYKYIIQLD